MRMTRKKLISVVAAAVLVVAMATAAFSFWTTSGSGSNDTTTAAGQIDNLSFATDSLTAMFPGDSAQVLNVTVTNNATQSATVSTVKVYVTTDSAGCTGADYLINGVVAPSTAATAVALDWTQTDIAASGTHATNGTDHIQFNDVTSTNQDACKGATVHLNYLAS